ncbi:MAG TPA: hypothetical protein VEL74_18500 [Thermoanaerobaculia bacterium]|nr:hypothetical protein [Thermoanaerobaculia bacterium]
MSIAAAMAAAPLPCQPCAGVRLEPLQPQAAPAAPSPAETGGVSQGSQPVQIPEGNPTEIQPQQLPPMVAGPDSLPTVPSEIGALLQQSPKLEPGSPLFVAWDVLLGEEAAPVSVGAEALGIVQTGGTPWLSLVFRTPAPVTQNVARLQAELRGAAAIAAAAPANTWFQVAWRPEGAETQAFAPGEYAFLLKRAAVALTGARADAKVASAPLPADPAQIRAFYGEEVAAYLEAVALQPAPAAALTAAVAALQELDPGRPVVLDAVDYPADPSGVLSEAARQSARGIGLTLFRKAKLTAADLAPLALLARELAGDFTYDPASTPTGAGEAWTFIGAASDAGGAGDTLELRVIAEAPAGASELTLRFPDAYLRRPTRFPYTPGRFDPPSGRVEGDALLLTVTNPGRVEVVGLERATAAEREGVEERVTIATEREMPVEEILRRLQAFEDAQARRLDHYRATNTTHMRFQPAAGTQSIEATLQGPFFFDPQTGSDWAWEALYVNGVRWRGKSIPEIPLVQPEKAAALPLEIHFNKQYRYRLRGTDTLDGRPAWVVDFAPTGPAAEGGKLYQGTVWVDRQIYSRLRTRAVQLGLEGEVISNEETMHYTPVDAEGKPAPWGPQSYVLPLRIVAQQLLSVVNSATVVERETLLTDVRINAAGFEEARRQVAGTDVTMVRDTAEGLRYLVKDDSGERVVQEGFDTSKLFALGGVFYDDALDYPLPLAGVNYFSFDFRGTGKQVNAFFAGALLTADIAEPRLFGSRFDAGVDLFALAIPLTDTVYRGDREANEEDVELRTGNIGFKIGHPVGNFMKLGAEYTPLFFNYGRADDTDPNFVIPEDHVLHALDLRASFNRSGYGFSLTGSYNKRSEWKPWGLPGNPEYSEDHEDFLRWEARASKNWYLRSFQKVGIEFDYASGQDLDRFSKYQFGFFGGTRVHGYQSNRVRATEVLASHVSYGFEVGQMLRLEALGDVAWATDEDTGLDNELLGGLGIAGTFMGPWQTVVNLDLGVPVAGPDDGFVVYVVFLKLFN